MHSRRKFLIQGSLATTAMLALKPLETIARAGSPFSGNHGKIVFLHTTDMDSSCGYRAVPYIRGIKEKHSGAVLLHAGKEIPAQTGALAYDASVHGSIDPAAMTGDYKIINRGKLRMGIISANPGESDVVQKVIALSALLKEEKKCDIVVCLSQLGFKNNHAPDDQVLASQSTHLDIIIGGHSENFAAHPYIALNSIKGEVIIHSASADPLSCGVINMDFNSRGQKKFVSFTA